MRGGGWDAAIGCQRYYEDDVIGPDSRQLHRQRGLQSVAAGMINGSHQHSKTSRSR